MTETEEALIARIQRNLAKVPWSDDVNLLLANCFIKDDLQKLATLTGLTPESCLKRVW